MVEEALFARLTNHAGTTALIAARCYPDALPARATVPAVTYQRISGPRVSAMGSDTGVAHPRFTMKSWATTYTGAKALAAQVRAALQRYRGTIGSVEILDVFIVNEMDLPAEGKRKKLFGVMQDFIVWHRES